MSELFSFQGRYNRGKYWGVSVGQLIVILVAAGLLAMLWDISNVAAILIGLAVYIVIAWTGLATQAKRLHDRSKSAHWLWLYILVPSVLNGFGVGLIKSGADSGALLSLCGLLISLWALVDIGILRGTSGDNAYGSDPLSQAVREPAIHPVLPT